MRRARAACVALVLAAAVLSGCGGSDLSPAALRGRASAICRVANARERRIGTPTELGETKPFLRAGSMALAVELSQLRRLRPGGKARAEFRRALAGVGAELHELQGSMRALGQGAEPVLTVKTLQRRLASIERDADDAWRALGIRDCLSR